MKAFLIFFKKHPISVVFTVLFLVASSGRAQNQFSTSNKNHFNQSEIDPRLLSERRNSKKISDKVSFEDFSKLIQLKSREIDKLQFIWQESDAKFQSDDIYLGGSRARALINWVYNNLMEKTYSEVLRMPVPSLEQLKMTDRIVSDVDFVVKNEADAMILKKVGSRHWDYISTNEYIQSLILGGSSVEKILIGKNVIIDPLDGLREIYDGDFIYHERVKDEIIEKSMADLNLNKENINNLKSLAVSIEKSSFENQGRLFLILRFLRNLVEMPMLQMSPFERHKIEQIVLADSFKLNTRSGALKKHLGKLFIAVNESPEKFYSILRLVGLNKILNQPNLYIEPIALGGKVEYFSLYYFLSMQRLKELTSEGNSIQNIHEIMKIAKIENLDPQAVGETLNLLITQLKKTNGIQIDISVIVNWLNLLPKMIFLSKILPSISNEFWNEADLILINDHIKLLLNQDPTGQYIYKAEVLPLLSKMGHKKTGYCKTIFK